MTKIIGVRFLDVGKIYYFDPDKFEVKSGDKVIVETQRGIECGQVVLGNREVHDENINKQLDKVIRVANEEDIKILNENKEKEKSAFELCKEKILEYNLEMKLISAEYTFDNTKLLFYFTSEGRVDFRDLVKDLASIFKVRIELRQVGVRDETKLVGGIGSCGRVLCCHGHLPDFEPVSIKMAKEQNISLNPQKISGSCGRLMCCLKNEEESYKQLNKTLPNEGQYCQTKDNKSGQVVSVNVLRQKVKLIFVDKNGDKEVLEYPVDELEFKGKR